jgi:hypothetical protein
MRIREALIGQPVDIEPTGRMLEGLNDRRPAVAIVHVRIAGESFAEFAAQVLEGD